MHHHERPDATSGILPQERGAVFENPTHEFWLHWVLRINRVLTGGGAPVAVAQDTRADVPLMRPTSPEIEAVRRIVNQFSLFTYEQVEPYYLSDGDKIRVQDPNSAGTTLFVHHDRQPTPAEPPPPAH